MFYVSKELNGLIVWLRTVGPLSMNTLGITEFITVKSSNSVMLYSSLFDFAWSMVICCRKILEAAENLRKELRPKQVTRGCKLPGRRWWSRELS